MNIDQRDPSDGKAKEIQISRVRPNQLAHAPSDLKYADTRFD